MHALCCSEDILGMEKQMLAALEYDLTVPTCYLFTARFRKAAGVQEDVKVRQLGICCQIKAYFAPEVPAGISTLAPLY
jgi:hypothetical protein